MARDGFRGEYTLIDYTPTVIDFLKSQKASTAFPRASFKFYHLDARNTGFPDEQFDFILDKVKFLFSLPLSFNCLYICAESTQRRIYAATSSLHLPRPQLMG
jgi:hypothetical protein